MKNDYTYNVKTVNNFLVFELQDHEFDFDVLPDVIGTGTGTWFKTSKASKSYFIGHPGDSKVEEYIKEFLKKFNAEVDEITST